MRSHISVQRDTTKYFSNSFVFKNKIEKEGLPRDSPAGSGAGGREFESRCSRRYLRGPQTSRGDPDLKPTGTLEHVPFSIISQSPVIGFQLSAASSAC